jgi:hypothetical protein
MTDKEAMKLALEALENFGNHDNACPQWPTYSEPEKYPKCNCGYDDAITALKERLGNPMREVQRLGQEIEQDPVAWINAEKRIFEWNGPVLWNTPTVAVLNKIPLYSHPPQRIEQNFCSRCGKRTPDLITIHICTPSQENT